MLPGAPEPARTDDRRGGAHRAGAIASWPVAHHVEDFSPGSGSRSTPRAWVLSDAPSLSLDGTWQFRLHPTHRGLAEPPAVDGDWGTVTVPSHWVLGPD